MHEQTTARSSRSRSATLALLVVAVALVSLVTVATASGDDDPWRSNDHARRLVVEVEAGATARLDEVVEVPIDLTPPGSADLDAASVLVLEVDGDGDVLGEVPVQVEGATTPNAARVVFVATGTTSAGSERRFHVYVGEVGEGAPGWSGSAMVTTAATQDEGQDVWRITNRTGSLSYVRDAAGFSSYDDVTADDWISWNVRQPGVETFAESEFRGIPNAIFDPGGTNYFHPGHPTSTSTLVVNGPVRTVIRSEAVGADWVSQWTIGPRTATFEMLAADTGAWWFLYEGTPGGAVEPGTDDVLLSDGTSTLLSAPPSNADLPDPEWVAYRDGTDARSLLVVSHDDDSLADRRTVLDGAMTVFGFGRSNSVPQLIGPGRTMSIELVESRSPTELGRRAADHRAPVVPVVSGLQTRPAATTTSTPVSSTTTSAPAPTTTTPPPPTSAPDPTVPRPPLDDAALYRLLDRTGRVYSFPDDPTDPGGAPGQLGAAAVDLLATASGEGYWILDEAGGVRAFGDAPDLGGLPEGTLVPGEAAATLSRTADDDGYWIATNRGRVLPFGAAPPVDDLIDLGIADVLNGPIVDSVATADGSGFYLLGSDGGVFALGSARFLGSMGGTPLNAPVDAIVTDPDGAGYWLVGTDGGVFAFEAEFRGSMGGIPLNAPVVGMVPYGSGYVMVGADGGVFVFSDLPFLGSLGSNPPADPVVAIGA